MNDGDCVELRLSKKAPIRATSSSSNSATRSLICKSQNRTPLTHSLEIRAPDWYLTAQVLGSVPITMILLLHVNVPSTGRDWVGSKAIPSEQQTGYLATHIGGLTVYVANQSTQLLVWARTAHPAGVSVEMVRPNHEPPLHILLPPQELDPHLRVLKVVALEVPELQ